MRAHSLGPEDVVNGEVDVGVVYDFADGEDLGGGQDDREVDFEGSWLGVPVEADVDKPVVAELAAPHLPVERGRLLVDDQVGLLAQRVLVDCDHFLVAQDGQGLLRDAAEAAANQKRRLQGSPKREVRLVLIIGHQSVADFQHIRIVPAARSSIP